MRTFTEEQVIFRNSYRKFLDTEIAPYMKTWRENGIVDRRAFTSAGSAGMLMVWPDAEYGGLGDSDFRFEQIIIEETARAGCLEWYNSLHSRIVGPYFERLGTAEQKMRFLPGAVTGEVILGIAITEPDAGSDVAGIRCQAEDKGDHFLLNGSKTYISNGINADVIIVAAKCAPSDDPRNMVLLILERGMEGFERGRNLEKMGQKAQDTAEIYFNNVRVPRSNVLGEAGQGFGYLMEGLAEERLVGAVGYAANARRAFNITRDFVLQRKLFGKLLSEFQNTQFQLAELDAELDAVQVYIDHCVYEHNAGRLSANMGAKAKLLSSEVEWKVLDLGVQLHGGAGYMLEYPIAGMFIDARVNRIYAGTSEVMKYIIGRDIFSGQYASMLD